MRVRGAHARVCGRNGFACRHVKEREQEAIDLDKPVFQRELGRSKKRSEMKSREAHQVNAAVESASRRGGRKSTPSRRASSDSTRRVAPRCRIVAFARLRNKNVGATKRQPVFGASRDPAAHRAGQRQRILGRDPDELRAGRTSSSGLTQVARFRTPASWFHRGRQSRSFNEQTVPRTSCGRSRRTW